MDQILNIENTENEIIKVRDKIEYENCFETTTMNLDCIVIEPEDTSEVKPDTLSLKIQLHVNINFQFSLS